jgi:asparagine synthase (glutamine-hydrolysing)
MHEKVRSALELLHARGPDQSNFQTLSERCTMGGNRLIIRGKPGAGDMPFQLGQRMAWYNGEIYNYGRWLAEGVSDGEAILPAYQELGPECFAQFEGEFAISIWDDATETVVLARDQFGAKPLYFSYDGESLLWASSASAINRMQAHPFCASFKSSAHHLMQSPQEPYTSFSGIWMLPPGHVMIVSRTGVNVYAYHLWAEATAASTDPTEAFAALEKSLHQRMDYGGVIGIPMSGGIDSGIIAFTADRLGIPYHLFSVVEAGGRPTPEAPFIFERLKRLRPTNVTLLSCNEPEYALALDEIYQADYYSCEYFDPGAIPMHTVVRAMHQAGIRVALEGSGGDELFHGYSFRRDFAPIPGWPTPWRTVWGFYSIFTTLLAWTAKMDRAGAHFSIEARHPFQSVPLALAAMRLRPTSLLKWPLRRYLLERLEYGAPTQADLALKFGFTLEHLEKSKMVSDMQRAWCVANGLSSLPRESPRTFPFKIGLPLPQAA